MTPPRTLRGRAVGRPSPSTSAASPSARAHPIVVQSMTNTDTADADATAVQVARARPRRQRAGARHGQQRGGGGGGPARSCAELRRPGRRRAGHRRLPLQRPPAADRVSRLRRGRWPSTGSTRATSAASAHDENFRDDRRGRARQRQAGAHRRQLGLARPAPAHRDDGRERASAASRATRATSRWRRWWRARSAPPSWPRTTGLRPRPDHPQRQGLRRAGPGRRLPHARGALRLPAAPRPHRGGHGRQGHRRDAPRGSRSCSRRASATRSASR